MVNDPTLQSKAGILDELAMTDETAVQAFGAGDYLKDFMDFYEIKNRSHRLIPSAGSFHDALCEVCGDDVWQRIAEETERLFGTPQRVTVFEDPGKLIGELEGSDGLAPFFFVFDVMFCEYDGFTLCFISGTNN